MYFDNTTESEIGSQIGTEKRIQEAKVRNVDNDWLLEPEQL